MPRTKLGSHALRGRRKDNLFARAFEREQLLARRDYSADLRKPFGDNACSGRADHALRRFISGGPCGSLRGHHTRFRGSSFGGGGIALCRRHRTALHHAGYARGGRLALRGKGLGAHNFRSRLLGAQPGSGGVDHGEHLPWRNPGHRC